jgi:hypothetical protein
MDFRLRVRLGRGGSLRGGGRGGRIARGDRQCTANGERHQAETRGNADHVRTILNEKGAGKKTSDAPKAR